MINTLWDICLLIIGFGTILCIPLTLLAAIGLFVTFAIQSITPSHPNSLVIPTVSQTKPQNEVSSESASSLWETLDPDVLPEWLRNDPQQNIRANSTQISNQTQNFISSEKPTMFQSSLRWLSIILIYTIAYGMSMVLGQLTTQFFQPPVQIAVTILIFTAFVIIGLTSTYFFIKKSLTMFQAKGWFLAATTSVLSGSIVGIYIWNQENQCTDSICIYNSQVSGLAVAIGVFFAMFYLVEWWAVWSEKYRTGRWRIGIFTGLVVTVLIGIIIYFIANMELIALAPIIGWTVCLFIVTSKVSGDGFYEKRLGGVFPWAVSGAIILFGASLIAAQPRCLCVQEISELAWRWFAAGAIVGSLSGITWLYLWQTAPIDARTVFMYPKNRKR